VEPLIIVFEEKKEKKCFSLYSSRHNFKNMVSGSTDISIVGLLEVVVVVMMVGGSSQILVASVLNAASLFLFGRASLTEPGTR